MANLSVYLAKNINNRLVILRITRYHRHTGKYRNNSDGGDGNVSRCSADNSRQFTGIAGNYEILLTTVFKMRYRFTGRIRGSHTFFSVMVWI